MDNCETVLILTENTIMRIEIENAELTFLNLLRRVFCLHVLMIYDFWNKKPSQEAYYSVLPTVSALGINCHGLAKT